MLRYEGEQLKGLMRALKFRDDLPNTFLWTLVLLHRRIALGDEISNLGSFLEQYSEHTIKCGRPYDGSKDRFKYDAGKKYTGMRLTYQTLTALVMNPGLGNGNAILMAEQWDDAIGALIKYNLNCTDTNWSEFRRLMNRASKPFW